MIRKAILTVSLLAATFVAHANPIFTESFDNISALTGAGWSLVNNSTPGGTTGWFQGNTGVFDSHAGAADSYIAGNFENAGFGGNISNWLISPTLTLFNGADLTFYTRSAGFYNDRLEVRLSGNGASGNVGASDASVGDFTTLLASVNPLLDGNYATDWTAYTVKFSGITDGTLGRFAFRYFVTDTFSNGDYIGIDSVSLSVPEPAAIVLLAVGLFTLGFATYKRSAGPKQLVPAK